jgi:hypothetical protein
MPGWLSPRGRVLSRAGLGILTFAVAPDLVDEAVGDGLAWEMRLRALPSRLGVYFILGLCLFSQDSCGQVLQDLTAGLETVLGAVGWQVPASTALTAVRRRIGEQPLRSLFMRLAGALSPGRAPWSHICGLLAVAWDGTTIDAADTEANAAAFGRPGTAKGKLPAAFPQIRLLALVACGTRALIGAAIGPARGKSTGERELAGQLLGRLRAGMLLLADRGFYSYQLWTAAAGTGAHLLWRVPGTVHLPVARVLPDGSYLTHVSDPAAVRARARRNGARRRRRSKQPPETGPLPGITARVIVFTLTITAGGGTRREQYRLLTTLTDWRTCPAADLAGGYARRWAIETGFRDLKTTLRGTGRRLRGKTPELARQEVWAYLVIYQALHAVIARAAARDGLDPARISFTAALHAARDSIRDARDHMSAALDAADDQILSCLVPERHGRVCVRAVRQPRTAWPAVRTRPLAQHTDCTITITAPPPATHTSNHQHKQPAQQPNSPP